MHTRLPPVVDWSCRLYGHLLAILPGTFRHEFDQPILQAFRDLCLAAWQARGPLGLVAVWMQALPDLAEGAAGEWRLALTVGGNMERVSVRTWMLMALMASATLLGFLTLPSSNVTHYGVGLLALAGILSVAVSGWRSRYWQPAAATGPGSDLAAADTLALRLEGGPSRIRLVLIGLVLAFLGLFVYVFRVLFTLQPSLAEAHRLTDVLNQIWNYHSFNTFQAGMVIIGAYLGVSVYGTRGRGPSARPWMAGVTAGGIAGLAAILLALTGQLNAMLVVMLAAAVLAGLIAGGLTGQTEAGALGGFWCGLACALVWATAGMVMDLTLISRLAGTAWASSQVCQGLVGAELAACAVGNDVFTWGKVLLALPILSGGLGVIGGLLGAALTKARPPVESKWGRALVVPVLFCGVMILVYAARSLPR